MSTALDLEWQRYGLIIELADRMHSNAPFGKTALQKLVYFLQELHHVDCDYDFTLYTYGPFSSQLLADLDSVHAMGAVEVEYDLATGGYSIKPGPKSETIKKKARHFLQQYAADIEDVVRRFGRLSAKSLELRATLIYADRDVRSSGKAQSAEELVRVVHDLKPHFDDDTIFNAYRELNEGGFVT